MGVMVLQVWDFDLLDSHVFSHYLSSDLGTEMCFFFVWGLFLAYFKLTLKFAILYLEYAKIVTVYSECAENFFPHA